MEETLSLENTDLVTTGIPTPNAEGPIQNLSESDWEKNRRYAMVTNMRKFLAYNFLYYNMLWATAIVSVLYFNNYFLKLALSDTVIVTLLTTATLNFNGMMYVILRNIYPKEVE